MYTAITEQTVIDVGKPKTAREPAHGSRSTNKRLMLAQTVGVFESACRTRVHDRQSEVSEMDCVLAVKSGAVRSPGCCPGGACNMQQQYKLKRGRVENSPL